MKNKNKILRLSEYKNVLFRLKELGILKISSTNIGNAVGVKPTQVRKDFSEFNITGNKRGGYNINNILEKINIILGKNSIRNVIVIGAGRIGSALLTYKGFHNIGIKIIAVFDINENIDQNYNIPVYHINKLSKYIIENKIKIAILTIPDSVAQEITDEIVEAGIKGILNFSQIKLSLPENIVVNEVHIEAELENSV